MSSVEVVERLHFFDGQRLDARDLSLEQRYHLTLRRLLNKGLFSAGVVDGLEVKKLTATRVEVEPGLALDPDGREIVLFDPVPLDVPNQTPPGPLGGYFVVIRYHEQQIQGGGRECDPGNGAAPPSRIMERPELGWTQDWPDHTKCAAGSVDSPDCAVVLALVLLDTSCQIQKIDPGPRQIARSTMPTNVQAYALEGEKDIDKDNPKELRFDLRGGSASSIDLFLQGAAFSSLYYTQVGKHSHPLSATGKALNVKDTLSGHKHGFNGGSTDKSYHRHMVKTGRNTIDYGEGRNPRKEVSLVADEDDAEFIGYGPEDYAAFPDYDYVMDLDGHTHLINAGTSGPPDIDSTGGHHHDLSGKTDPGGVSGRPHGLPANATAGAGYGYPDGVVVSLNGSDITGWILTKNPNFGPPTNPRIGDGTAGHQFVTIGATNLDLTQSPIQLRNRVNVLKFSVPAGGCKIMWNLYVE